MTRQAHTAYLSPSTRFTGKHIEAYDRARYAHAKAGCDDLRRALLNFYYKRQVG